MYAKTGTLMFYSKSKQTGGTLYLYKAIKEKNQP